jgi:transposase InsO family protein
MNPRVSGRYISLRREKAEDGTLRWRVNHKRVYRLYREEGLVMHRRRRKRFRAEARVPLALPTRANEVWTMDYAQDELAAGRNFRTLNLMDSYTREALRIEPDTSLPGLRVVRVLESLRGWRGTPAAPWINGRIRTRWRCTLSSAASPRRTR